MKHTVYENTWDGYLDIFWKTKTPLKKDISCLDYSRRLLLRRYMNDTRVNCDGEKAVYLKKIVELFI